MRIPSAEAAARFARAVGDRLARAEPPSSVSLQESTGSTREAVGTLAACITTGSTSTNSECVGRQVEEGEPAIEARVTLGYWLLP